jgi:hypothetical protein
MKTKTGHAAVLEYNSTYKHHHIPIWFKTSIRKTAISKGKWQKGESHMMHFINDRDYHGLWDHWGSIEIGRDRSVITQPYGDHLQLAEKFAEDHGCILQSMNPGPWHPNTRLYIFSRAPIL